MEMLDGAETSMCSKVLPISVAVLLSWLSHSVNVCGLAAALWSALETMLP